MVKEQLESITSKCIVQLTSAQQQMDWVKVQLKRGYIQNPSGLESIQSELNKAHDLLKSAYETLEQMG